jgi:hypothetical protein
MWWHISVILERIGSREDKRIMVQSGLGKNHTLSKSTEDITQVVEYLAMKCQTLISNLRTTKKVYLFKL